MTEATYIASVEFARLANISNQKSRRALARAFNGHRWRGHALIVRRVKGQGGKSGQQYQVRIDSLPITLQEEWRENPTDLEKPVLEIDAPNPLTQWRYEVIEAALKHPSKSSQRAFEIEQAARQVRTFPSGRRDSVSERTIRSWISAYERHGYAGLRPVRRADRAQRRTCITREWDAAVSFDDATQANIKAALERRIASLWAANDTIGWKRIAYHAADELIELTQAAGCDLPLARLYRICRVPRHLVEQQRGYRAIAIYDKDRKKHFDTSLPRIKRTRGDLRPMQIVVSDVHHIDVLLTRTDGSTFTPKVVAFLDLATNRFFSYVVFPEKGTMVRQEHFVEAYIAMTQDPRWGLPQQLYIDNGGEFNIAELIDDAQQLDTQVRHLNDDMDTAEFVRARRSSIVKALPYNAPAKAIEGIFNVFERGFLSMLQGWIGGDRMAKKTANIGKQPTPFHGDEHEFCEALADLIVSYELQPQSGLGKSPRQAFNDFVIQGWKRRPVDPAHLRAVFAISVTKTIRQGKFRHDGEWYTHPTLQRLSAGTKVIARVPKDGTRDQMPVTWPNGELICVAIRDEPFSIFDPAGAVESATRKRRNIAGIEDMRTDVDKIDLLTLERRAAAKAAPALIPENLEPVQLGETLAQIGYEMGISPDEKKARDENRRKQRQKEIDTGYEKMLRAIGGNR